MKDSPRFYIIVVNFKGHKDTIECLESLLKLTYSNVRILVVDNSPTNESIEYIQTWANGGIKGIETQFPEIIFPLASKPVKLHVLEEGTQIDDEYDGIILIKSKENRGFAAANNLAIRSLQSNKIDCWFWLLNNDTIVFQDSLEKFVHSLKKNESSQQKIGIIGTKLSYYKYPDRLQGIGGSYNRYLATTSHVLADECTEMTIDYFDLMKVDYPIGASMFVNSKFIEDVGLMCEDYFLYYEEIDWAIRGRERGYEVGLCDSCVVYHKEGASINHGGFQSFLSDKYSVINRIKITRKFYPQFLPIVCASMIGVIAIRLKRLQFGRALLLVKSILSLK